MKIKSKDYVVVEVKPGKNRLAKVKTADDDIINVVYTTNQHIQELREAEEVQKSSIILNLGPDPKPGSVYGCSTESLYRGPTEHPDFGKIYWMYKPEKQVVKSLNTAFNIVLKRLRKYGLEDLAQDQIVWEAHPYYKQKWAGMYIHAKEGRSRILIRPEHSEADSYPYILAHELGHRIHRQWLQHPGVEARWIKLYNTSIQVSPVDPQVCKSMVKKLGPDFTLKDLKRGLDDDDEKAALKLILRSLKTNHGLTPHELDLLLKADEVDEVRELWPEHVDLKSLAPVISEYATVNYAETIAEAISMHLTGMQLPKVVVKLTEKTLALAKANLTGGHAPGTEE